MTAPYEVRQTAEFREWVSVLRDTVVREAVAQRLLRLESGLLGDHGPLGDRVSELRIHYGAGFRLYYTVRERVIVIMLAGGSKRTQSRDVDRAKTIELSLQDV